MATVAEIHQVEVDFEAGGRTCFIEFETVEAAKVGIADLLFAGLEFTVVALHTPEQIEGLEKPEVQFALTEACFDDHSIEEAFIAYAVASGGTYTGS